jgi:hypothetical protein
MNMKRFLVFLLLCFALQNTFAGGEKDTPSPGSGGAGTPASSANSGAAAPVSTPLPTLVQPLSDGNDKLAAVTSDGTYRITVTDLRAEIRRLLQAEYTAQAGKLPTTEELDAAIQRLSMDQKKMVLNQLINNQLALAAAERENIKITDTELNQAVNSLRSQLSTQLGRQATDAEFAAAIKQQFGLELPAFREQMRKETTIRKYLETKIKLPTDEEAAAEYNKGPSAFVLAESVDFTALVVTFASAAARTAAKADADRIAREIGGSITKFNEYSQVTTNVSYRTTKGTVRRDEQSLAQTSQAFLDAVFALREGQEVSPVLEIPAGTVAGYYIIKVTAKYPAKPLALDDTVPEYNMTLREYIKNILGLSRQQELVTKLREEKSYAIFEDNLNF